MKDRQRGSAAPRYLAVSAGVWLILALAPMDVGAEAPGLEELDERVLQSHEGIQAAKTGAEQLRQEAAWIEGRRPDPSIEYMLEVGAPWGDHSTVGHGIEITQPLRWPGARAAEAAPVRASATTADYDQRRVAMDALKELRLALVELGRVEAQLELIADEVGLLEDATAVVEATAPVSGGDYGEFYQLELAREQVLDRRAQLISQREEQRAQVGALFERGEGKGLSSIRGLDMESGAGSLPPWEAVERMVRDHAPEVAVEASREDSERRRLELVDQRRRPAPMVMVGYSNKAPMWEMEGPRDQMIHIGVGMTLPIWGSTYDREASARQTAMEGVVSEARQVERDILAEAEAQYAAWREVVKREQRYRQEMLPLARDLASQVLLGLELGERSASDFLMALNQEIEVEQALIEVRAQGLRRQINLQRLSGGVIGEETSWAYPQALEVSDE